MFYSVLCLLYLCTHLFIRVLLSPAGKGLTSWLSFVVYNWEFVTFPFKFASYEGHPIKNETFSIVQ